MSSKPALPQALSEAEADRLRGTIVRRDQKRLLLANVEREAFEAEKDLLDELREAGKAAYGSADAFYVTLAGWLELSTGHVKNALSEPGRSAAVVEGAQALLCPDAVALDVAAH